MLVKCDTCARTATIDPGDASARCGWLRLSTTGREYWGGYDRWFCSVVCLSCWATREVIDRGDAAHHPANPRPLTEEQAADRRHQARLRAATARAVRGAMNGPDVRSALMAGRVATVMQQGEAHVAIMPTIDSRRLLTVPDYEAALAWIADHHPLPSEPVRVDQEHEPVFRPFASPPWFDADRIVHDETLPPGTIAIDRPDGTRSIINVNTLEVSIEPQPVRADAGAAAVQARTEQRRAGEVPREPWRPAGVAARHDRTGYPP